MYKLGLDVGAFSVQLIILSEDNKIVFREESAHQKNIKKTVINLLNKAFLTIKEKEIKVSICGSMSHLLNLPNDCTVSSQIAISLALSNFEKNASSAIVLGAQKTMYLAKQDGKHYEILKNSNCSAGTGAFFEEQASRLQIDLKNISNIVTKAQSVPNIAGRCSVFAKTDMIHLMQEGIPSSDILLGLCYSLVKNYKSTILHNQKPSIPVYLAGGVMKNGGVIQAIKELFELNDGDYIIDENSTYLGALGCALKADSIGVSLSFDALISKINEETNVHDNSGLAPLNKFCLEDDSPEFKTVPYIEGEETYLGIDVGSTSINLVLINKKREVIYYSYVKTLGRPLDIVRLEIKKLHDFLLKLKNYKISVTGSGREYIGKEIGADLVINEITAQTEGALLSNPQLDTVFEIGGQDSKYMSCKNGKMIDFEMNKICATGTGAFLEEQINKLGISMADFTNFALKQIIHVCLAIVVRYLLKVV